MKKSNLTDESQRKIEQNLFRWYCWKLNTFFFLKFSNICPILSPMQFSKATMTSIDELLIRYRKLKKRIRFIQIGSNDGVTDDPLHAHIVANDWEGILVEPIPNLYEKLKNNYSQHNGKISFEMSAISSEDGHQTIYSLRENLSPIIPIWYNQLASLHKNVILSHKEAIEDIESFLVQEKVRTITFETLLKKYGIDSVELIHIDAEGSDAEILGQIDLTTLKCEIIIFEHKHLNTSTYKRALKKLRTNDFIYLMYGNDTVGIRSHIFEIMNL